MTNNTTRFNVSDSTLTCDRANFKQCAEFWAIEVTWVIYCCTGVWALDQPLRITTLILGLTKMALENIYRQYGRLTLSLFATYILGRTRVDTTRVGLLKGAAIVIWASLDFAALFYEPLKWICAAYEGVLVVVLLAYLTNMAMALQERGRRRWLLKLGAITLWGAGWGITAMLYWLLPGMGTITVVWFMLYEALFPRDRKPVGSPGRTPVILRSPWLSALAQRRAGRNTRAN